MDVRCLVGGAALCMRQRLCCHFVQIALLALAAGFSVKAEAGPAPRPLDHLATVLNGRIVGSAFLIEADLAVTNAHVVEGVRPGAVLALSGPDGVPVPGGARVVAISPRMDLALLRVPAGYLPVVDHADAAPRVGLVVRGAGIDASRGRGPGPVLALQGRVLEPRADLPAFGPGLVAGLPGVRPGFSGGPLLDSQGRLVGMITAIRNGAAYTTRPVSGVAPQARRTGTPDQAFALRAAEIRAEARRLLLAIPD